MIPTAIEIPACWRERMEPGLDATAWMSPADFLRLARTSQIGRPIAGFDWSRVCEWEEWPYLVVDPETMQVTAHEGRNRVRHFAACGIERVEILLHLEPDPCRHLADPLSWVWDGTVPDVERLIPEDAWHERL